MNHVYYSQNSGSENGKKNQVCCILLGCYVNKVYLYQSMYIYPFSGLQKSILATEMLTVQNYIQQPSNKC